MQRRQLAECAFVRQIDRTVLLSHGEGLHVTVGAAQRQELLVARQEIVVPDAAEALETRDVLLVTEGPLQIQLLVEQPVDLAFELGGFGLIRSQLARAAGEGVVQDMEQGGRVYPPHSRVEIGEQAELALVVLERDVHAAEADLRGVQPGQPDKRQ